MSQQQTAFVLADRALERVVNQIKDSQWDEKVPEPLANGRDVTLRELINYHAFDDVWVPDTLAGKLISEVGAIHDGDLLGPDPKAGFSRIVDTVTEVVQAFPEADLDRTVHLSYGDYPAREYLEHITTFRGFRSYTIAKYIGVDSTMSPELVAALREIVEPNIELWRQMKVFGPEISVPDDADAQTKLLGLTGFWQA